MGQWLCVPMILGGVLLWVWAETRGTPPRAAREQHAARAPPAGIRRVPSLEARAHAPGRPCIIIVITGNYGSLVLMRLVHNSLHDEVAAHCVS
jgi:hypothetical protein